MKTCPICGYRVFSGGFCKRHYGLSEKGKKMASQHRQMANNARSPQKGTPPRKPAKSQKKGKKTGFQLAVREADKWFSRYGRLLFMREDGVVQCVTHPTGHDFFDIMEIQWGHFQVRQKLATRWTLENGAPQCRGCNFYDQGAQVRLGEWLDSHFGKGTADRMRVKATIGRKINEFEVRQIAGYWKLEFDKLAAEKGNPWRK